MQQHHSLLWLPIAAMFLSVTTVKNPKHYDNYPPPLRTVTPADCSINLRDDYLFDSAEIAIKDSFWYYKEEPPNNNFFDVVYQADDNIGCVDTNAFNKKDCAASDLHKALFGGDRSALRYKVYYPKKTVHDYDNVPLPVVIIFHAGGFTECSDYDDGGNENDILAQMAMEFARKGFICILAHYRTGRIKDANKTKVSTQQMLAVYRAIQDVRGLIRSVIKRNALTGHGNENGTGGYRFKINTNQVFIGGLSAGAVATLGAAYYRTQTMANQVFLNKSNSDLNIEDALGNIKTNDYYYAADSSQYNINIRGVLNCWGGIVFPKEYDGAPDQPNEEYEFFQGGGSLANPPAIGFAGREDKTIWYVDEDKQDFRFSVDSIYKKENFCLYQNGYFKIKADGNDVFVKQGSAFNLYNILKDLNRFTELYEDPNADHGLGPLANFGFAVYDKDTIVKYIVQRSAIFFQTIMSWQLSNSTNYPVFGYRGDSYFINCKNNRICTDTTSNNACP